MPVNTEALKSEIRASFLRKKMEEQKTQEQKESIAIKNLYNSYIFCLRKTPLLAVGMNQTLSQPKADEYAQVL